MLKMSGFDVLFAAAGNLYLLLALAGICAALWFGKTWTRKLVYAVLVLALFIAPITPEIYRTVEFRSRFVKAQALFEERCKTAGEKIYKTVDNVEGVLLLNVRQGDIAENRTNPNWEGAALPNDATGLGYIENFLVWEHSDGKSQRGYLNNSPDKATSQGYQFVDVKQEDGSVLRYRLSRAGSSELVSENLRGEPARYSVEFTSQGHPRDRKHWVAGVSITLSDTRSGEVLAQHISYAFEPGLGNTSGARSPWGFAVTCPAWHGWDGARTRFFVDQVLKPVQGK
jgi:hypothetical protein